MFAMTVRAADENIAAGRPYQFSATPNYSLCTGESDGRDLTDGQTGQGQIWVEQGTVGWVHKRKPISITVDLGSVQPIGGVAVHTAAGSAGVSWPHAITALVSDDGEAFRFAAELTTASDNQPAAYGKTTDHAFRATGLATSGRYVRIVLIASGSYLFCDEIEVFAGGSVDADRIQAMPIITADEVSSPTRLTKLGIQRRLLRDLMNVKEALDASGISDAQRQEIEAEISRIRIATGKLSMPGNVDQFRAVLPINDLHRDVFAIHARLLRAHGFSGLTFWQTHRYAPLAPFGLPGGSLPQLDVEMVRGEHRAATFNITNASDTPHALTLTFAGLPGGAIPDDITVMETQFTDTREGRVVASALTPARRTGSGYEITIPAGMTRQIWLSFYASDTTPERSSGSVQIRGDGIRQDVPVAWRVVSAKVPSDAIALQVWDYATNQLYAITAGNRDEAIRQMQAYGVNVPWASRSSAPWPDASDFDAAGSLVGTLDFASFDTFVRAWPNAKRYMVFMRVQPGAAFCGAEPGTERFGRIVGQWVQAWAAHVREIGIKPGQVTLLLVDEPRTSEHWLATLHWARAIKQATDMFDIFVDPVHPHPPALEHSTEAIQYCDIVSPTRDHYEAGGEKLQTFYQNLAKDQGKELWLYSCTGPTRHYSPAYFRLQQWRCFEAGAVGSGFWAYGDTGGTANGWNPYTPIGSTSYTPVYIDADSVTTSKHWEAAREGMQDYACLTALAEAASSEQARQLARTLLDRAVAKYGANDIYNNPHATTVHEWSDQARLMVLRMLAEQVAAAE